MTKTLDGLARQVNALGLVIDTQVQAPTQEQATAFEYDLFAPDEQERLRAFLSRLLVVMGGILNLSVISDEDLHELELWARLQIALREREMDQARDYRACLNTHQASDAMSGNVWKCQSYGNLSAMENEP